MSWYRRSKLPTSSFTTLASKFLSKNNLVSQTDYSIPAINKFTVSQKTQFLGLSRRHYYVDRHQIRHFKQRGPLRWSQNPRYVIIAVIIGSGACISLYFGNLETIPYTKRKHFVLLSRSLEKQMGESQFVEVKKQFKGKILPAIHPDSVRVRLIAKDVIDSLQRGLKKEEQVWTDQGYVSDNYELGSHNSGVETLKGMTKSGEGIWSKDDEIFNDKWVQQSRKKGVKQGSVSYTNHLDGLNWEILVVDQPVVNAFCLPGGKIVVFSGLFKHFRSDDEIATIIAHEVAHAVARHSAETLTKNMWFTIIQLTISFVFEMPDLIRTVSHLLLRLPFSRRMEIEADYIGLLLSASAGYDPRIAPTVYMKLGEVSGGDSELQNYLSTHPSGKKRARLLSQAKVMEEALSIYREAKLGHGVQGFL